MVDKSNFTFLGKSFLMQSFLDSISGFKDKRGEQADLFADNAAH